MARQYDYECSRCGTITARDKLVVKKTSFLEMGLGGRTVRSRVAAWLCPTCLTSDADYNRESHAVPVYEPLVSEVA